jgi:phosphoenolpyruvate carboxykinase (ATP)
LPAPKWEVTEPEATFSSCFGGPFLVWHPNKYAELLAAKMKQHGVRVWLVNTGWSGGAYGIVQQRESQKHGKITCY